MFALALGFVAVELQQSWANPKSEARKPRLVWQFSAAWIVGLFLVTPLYHPYPRLTLPWICGLWLAGAAGAGQLLKAEWFQRCDYSPAHRRWMTGVTAAAGSLIVLAAGTGRLSLQPAAWQSRTQWEPIAEQVIDAVSRRARSVRNDPNEAIVFVYGEPALFFHLNAIGTHGYIPAGDLKFVETNESEVPLFLVAGLHADRTPGFVEEFSRVKTRMKLVAGYDYAPSDLVLLNQHHPRELKRDQRITQSVRLYEVVLDR